MKSQRRLILLQLTDKLLSTLKKEVDISEDNNIDEELITLKNRTYINLSSIYKILSSNGR